jgi:DNA-binding GntR family transcriptional regulator
MAQPVQVMGCSLFLSEYRKMEMIENNQVQGSIVKKAAGGDLDESLGVISQQTLEKVIVDRLREAIVEGYFAPGSQLNQVQIAARIGTSRGPLRAALRKLEEEGLVRNIPYKGTYVTSLDQKTASDLYKVRAVLEASGVRWAASNCTQQDIDYLTGIVDKMREAAQVGDTNEVIRYDMMIHEFFIELSGNTTLQQIWSMLHVQLRRILAFRHFNYPDLQEIADSHLVFLDLLRKKDAEGAARVMEAHILEACEDLMARNVFKS